MPCLQVRLQHSSVGFSKGQGRLQGALLCLGTLHSARRQVQGSSIRKLCGAKLIAQPWRSALFLSLKMLKSACVHLALLCDVCCNILSSAQSCSLDSLTAQLHADEYLYMGCSTGICHACSSCFMLTNALQRNCCVIWRQHRPVRQCTIQSATMMLLLLQGIQCLDCRNFYEAVGTWGHQGGALPKCGHVPLPGVNLLLHTLHARRPFARHYAIKPVYCLRPCVVELHLLLLACCVSLCEAVCRHVQQNVLSCSLSRDHVLNVICDFQGLQQRKCSRAQVLHHTPACKRMHLDIDIALPPQLHQKASGTWGLAIHKIPSNKSICQKCINRNENGLQTMTWTAFGQRDCNCTCYAHRLCSVAATVTSAGSETDLKRIRSNTPATLPACAKDTMHLWVMQNINDHTAQVEAIAPVANSSLLLMLTTLSYFNFL